MNSPASDRFVDLLEGELLAAHARLRESAAHTTPDPVRAPTPAGRWRWPALVPATALAAVALVVGVLVVGDDAAPAAAFAVSSTTDALVIDVLDTVRDREAEASRLGEAGLEVRFDDAAVPPHLVDRVVVAALGADLQAGAVVATAGPLGLVEIRLPAGYAGGLVLVVGRPAADGEAYTQSTPDPDLCSAVGGRPLADVRDVLGDAGAVGLRVVVFGPDATTSPAPDADTDLAVIDVVEIDPTNRIVVVSDDPSAAGPAGCASLDFT